MTEPEELTRTTVSAPGSYVWTPGPERLQDARVARFARAHGINGIEDLRARSVSDVAWYWDAAVADLGLRFVRSYHQEPVVLGRPAADPVGEDHVPGGAGGGAGLDPGDLSGAENPDALAIVRAAVESSGVRDGH